MIFMKPRAAFTLLELIIALAILLLGMATLFRLTNIAGKSSLESQELAAVQLAVQTKLNELLMNDDVLISPQQGLPVSGVRNWKINVVIVNTNQTGLAAVHVQARNDVQQFELVRWVDANRINKQ